MCFVGYTVDLWFGYYQLSYSFVLCVTLLFHWFVVIGCVIGGKGRLYKVGWIVALDDSLLSSYSTIQSFVL